MTDKLSDGDLVSLISILRHAMTRGDVPVDLSPALLGAAKELDCLRAELTAARAVEDGEVAHALVCLDTIRNGSHFGQAFSADELIGIITRLSAAKEEAERERDMARAERLRAVQAANATGEFALALDTKRQAAESALAIALAERDSARADALEKAEKEVAKYVITRGTLDRIDHGHNAGIRRAIEAIRALKPAQGEQ